VTNLHETQAVCSYIFFLRSIEVHQGEDQQVEDPEENLASEDIPDNVAHRVPTRSRRRHCRLCIICILFALKILIL
jgi:hypothetical protein